MQVPIPRTIFLLPLALSSTFIYTMGLLPYPDPYQMQWVVTQQDNHQRWQVHYPLLPLPMIPVEGVIMPDGSMQSFTSELIHSLPPYLDYVYAGKPYYTLHCLPENHSPWYSPAYAPRSSWSHNPSQNVHQRPSDKKKKAYNKAQKRKPLRPVSSALTVCAAARGLSQQESPLPERLLKHINKELEKVQKYSLNAQNCDKKQSDTFKAFFAGEALPQRLSQQDNQEEQLPAIVQKMMDHVLLNEEQENLSDEEQEDF